jgi:hypothetical protein
MYVVGHDVSKCTQKATDVLTPTNILQLGKASNVFSSSVFSKVDGTITVSE